MNSPYARQPRGRLRGVRAARRPQREGSPAACIIRGGAATVTLFAAKGAALHLSISKLTVPVAQVNLFEWLKKLKVVIDPQHLDRGEVTKPRVISILEIYRSVLHADHRGHCPSLCLT